ncbi:hypothetical protein KM043_014521 [Ampulex compressa]|nr:hypothetical protein KM043_014521 [Ampulex compressa]
MSNSTASSVDKPPSYTTATAPTMNIIRGPPPGYHTTQCGINNVGHPPPGYYSATGVRNPSNYIPSYGSTQSTTIIVPDIIMVGGCPACRVGIIEDDYSCLGLLCAVFCFPLGLICCMLLKTKRCSNCGAYFG